MRRTLFAAALGLTAMLASGCALDGKQSALHPAGPVAERQMQVFLVTLWVSISIFVVVACLFGYCLAKFTVKEKDFTPDTPLPQQGHGNVLLEIGLILTSICLLGIIAVPTLAGIFYQGTLPADERNVIKVSVTGLQWWWKFEYPDLGVVTGNEVALPTGRPVKFELHTADVIHSFWIPRLGGKVDVMPGQTNWLWLQGDKAGLFFGQCAEFCGESHAFMRFRARVLDQMDFEAWIANQKADAVALTSLSPAAQKGAETFKAKQCATCHTVRGHGASGIIGPDLTHLASRASLASGIMDNTTDDPSSNDWVGVVDPNKVKENVKAWISDPEKHKPGNLMAKLGYGPKPKGFGIHVGSGDADKYPAILEATDIDNIAEYLSSLK